MSFILPKKQPGIYLPLFMFLFLPLLTDARQDSNIHDTLTQQQFIKGCANYRHQVIDSIISTLVDFNELCDSLEALSDSPEAFELFRENFMTNVLQCDFQNWRYIVDKAMPAAIRFENNFYRILKDWVHRHYYKLYQFNFLIANDIIDLTPTYKLSNLKAFWKEIQSYSLQSGQTFVDVGTGVGSLSFILAGTGMTMSLYMTEIYEEYIVFLNHQVDQLSSNAIGATSLTVVAAKEKELGLNSTFKADRILMRETYHHMKYRSDILQSVRKHLKADGMLILVESTKELEDDRKDRCHEAMRLEQIQKELEDNGFSLVGKKRIGSGYVLQYNIR